MQRLESANVAFANRERTPLTARVLRAAEHLELLAQSGRISPNVDADAATERGIALVAAGGEPGSHTAVAELGLALLLALARADCPPTIGECGRAIGWRRQRACRREDAGHSRTRQYRRMMARLGQALQMRVDCLGPDAHRPSAPASGVEYVAHDDLFARADALFVSTKLTDLTRGIVGAHELRG